MEERLEQLERKEEQNSYQTELAFQKELSILRNDFYYQMVDSKKTSLIDFMYKPLDILSGDAYSVRRINEHNTFYLLVDGMGKGIPASFTAVIMTTYVNHLIDKMVACKEVSLDKIIKEAIAFIQPVLLEDEILAIDFICFDSYKGMLSYAKFAMPPFLLQDKQDNIIKIKSNNGPLSKWGQEYSINHYDVANVEKFLFYSDGIVENMTIDNTPYNTFIEEDFKYSFTKEEFKEKFLSRIDKQEDDLTLIFINSLDMRSGTLIDKKVFASTLDDVEAASEWYEQIWEGLEVPDFKISYKAGVVFTELFMNAFEHGNLAIDAKKKHIYLEEDIYFQKLAELQEVCNKKIYVEVYKVKELASEYVITKICDEGKGFDTQILSEIFRNSHKFNGRGVFVSRKNSMGIYYNSKGTCVLFLNKI